MASFATKNKWGTRDRSLSDDFDLAPRPSLSPNPDNQTSPSRIPRPASTTNATRRPRQPSLSMVDAINIATEKHLAAQGSPSPAPRPRPKDSGSSDRRPLQSMIPDKPIDLGRLGSLGARRSKTPGAKEFDFQFEAHKDPERKWGFARDMLDLREGTRVSDGELLRGMKEKKDGPFARRRVPLNGNGAYTTRSPPPQTRQASATSAGSGSGSGTFGNRIRDEPRQTFANFAQSGTHPPDWLERFEGDGKAAFDFRAKVAPGPGGFLGEQRRTPPRQQNDNMPVERVSPISIDRPTGTAPSNKGFLWEVDDEFTAGDMQVSTSPPVSFSRTNTRIEEIKQAEIEAERDFPTKKSSSLQRTNTKIDEIRRLEEQYGLAGVDDEPTEADSDDNPIRRRQSGLGAPRRTSPPFSPRSNGRSELKPDFNNLGGEQVPNTPVTIYKNGSSNVDESDPRDEARPGPPGKKPSPMSEDSQDLLRRLARASSKSPSPTSAHAKMDIKSEEQKAEAPPVINDKATSDDKDIAVTSDDKDVRVKGGVLAESKTGLPFRRSVGFKGISRSSSIHSAASKESAASYDPTARLEAEAKLFALENLSERGSLRASSPLPEPEPKMDNKDDDKTPRPNKFVDPITLPTPKITGAYVDTPAPTRIEARGAEESAVFPSSKYLSPEKALSMDRDPITSPRASRSEGQRGYERRRPSRDLRRTKSTSRRRSPLKNSVKPPTVQEDLRQICLKNEIDDSELDDLTDLIMSSADPEKFINILKNDETQSEDDIGEQMRRLSEMSESLRTGLAGIRTAKKGIERLEDQVSRPEKQANPATTNTILSQPVPHAVGADGTQSDVYTYVHVPMPRLWRNEPKFKLTLVGWFLLLLSLWQLYWVVEDLFYDRWGKQTICYRGSRCRWDPDDPEYGYVVPVKVDEWVTGGAVRPHAAHWLEEAQDGWADFQDWLTGSDIRDVHHQSIRDSAKREQYWRRIEKKGLFPKWNPDPLVIPVIEAWEREAQAQEAAEARAAMEYTHHDEPDNETGSMAEDQPMTGDSTNDPLVSWW